MVFDVMHVFFVSGVFQKHMGCLMRAARQFDFRQLTYARLHSFCNVWVHPGAVCSRGCKPADPLEPSRAASSWEAGTFKCDASEALVSLPLSQWLLPSL